MSRGGPMDSFRFGWRDDGEQYVGGGRGVGVEKKKPTVFRDDLSVPPRALTKADYDRLMKDRKRNLTDSPIGSLRHGTPVLSSEEDGKEPRR